VEVLLVKDVTAEELEMILSEAEEPTIVDAFATWCGPCQMLRGELETAMETLSKRGVQAVSFDTDQYEAMASRLRVMGLPTIYFFGPRGVLLKRVEGAYPAKDLIQMGNEIFFGEAADDGTDELMI